MFTISLFIDCYNDEVFKREFPNFIMLKGLGKVSRINLASHDAGYYRFAIDVLTKDAEGLIFELEMLASGLEIVPDELIGVEFSSLRYSISAVPEDTSVFDMLGILNQALANTNTLRLTAVQLITRMDKLEKDLFQSNNLNDNSEAINQLVDVVNVVTEKTFGHKMIENDNQNTYEVKPKWLH